MISAREQDVGQTGMIAQTIQLALAPVFVLVAIGNIMNILSTRLARMVDRSRVLQERHGATSGLEHDVVVREIRALSHRFLLINRAILSLVIAGLVIGLVVTMLFMEEVLGIDLQRFAAAGFILAIGLLMFALYLFMRETRAATASLRIPESYLELERKL
jgi:type IV secretory pathway VirB6-like protein